MKILLIAFFLFFTGCTHTKVSPSQSSKFNLVAIEKGNITTVFQSIRMKLFNELKKTYSSRILTSKDIDSHRKAVFLKEYAVNGNSFSDRLARAERAGTIEGYNAACHDKRVSGINCEFANTWSDYERITGRDKLPEKYVIFDKKHTINGQLVYSLWKEHYERGEKKVDSTEFLFFVIPLKNNKVAVLNAKRSYPDSWVKAYIYGHKNSLKTITPIERDNIFKLFSNVEVKWGKIMINRKNLSSTKKKPKRIVTL